VLDTSVLVDHLRGDQRARDALATVKAEDGTATASVLTKAELLAGMRAEERADTRALMATIEWLDVDDDLAERAGALAARFIRSHPSIELVDFVIAATAQRLDARLLTRNLKHFPMFPDLGDPYDPD
jgi:predicted nucleic acid-binding protein